MPLKYSLGYPVNPQTRWLTIVVTIIVVAAVLYIYNGHQIFLSLAIILGTFTLGIVIIFLVLLDKLGLSFFRNRRK